MPHTLVLSANYQPVSIVPFSALSWQDAMRALCLGTSKTLVAYEDWEVRSPRQCHPVPAVLVTNHMVRFRNSVAFGREAVHLRDGYACQYCGVKGKKLTFDHVIPRAMGGKTNWTNITSACVDCNNGRGTNVSIKPMRPPFKPTYGQLVAVRRTLPITVPHASWIDFLGFDPSLVSVEHPTTTVMKTPSWLMRKMGPILFNQSTS